MSEGEVGFTERRWMPFTELSPLPIEIEDLKREIFEDCAKNKDQPRSSKAIQKNRDRKDQSQEGIRTAYPDEKIVQ